MSDQREAPPSVRGMGAMFRGIGRRLAAGEAGILLVFLMVGAIWTFFQVANDRFLSPGNLTNLMLQQAAVATISIGVVLILLLGEIDLSVAAASGFCASVMAVLMVEMHWSALASMLMALGLGAAIGLFNGLMMSHILGIEKKQIKRTWMETINIIYSAPVQARPLSASPPPTA